MNCIINNVSINYEIIGDGKPVVMIHGYGVDHKLMTGCMEPIFKNKQGFKRIYLDLPGMGKSESSEWIKNSDDMLDIVIHFIEEIIPNENILLAGQSYGGYLVRGLIHKMPQKIDGAAMICPVIIPNHAERTVEKTIVLVKDMEFLSKLTPEEIEEFNFVIQNERTYKRFTDEFSGLKIANEVFLENLQQNGYAFSFDTDNIMQQFNKPSLILLGKQDDCVGYKDAWKVLKNFPRATFAVLDMAGHSLQVEQERLFNSLVEDWIERVGR